MADSPAILSAVVNPFSFTDLPVRTATDAAGEVWFCAKDVFEALDIAWKGTGGSLKTTPDKWLAVAYATGEGGTQETTFIAEPAVYQVAFRSNKPAALRFTEWVCEEVLPAIRKQGYFGQVAPSVQVQLTHLMIKLSNEAACAANEFTQQLLLKRLRAVCNQLGEPMPDPALLKSPRQLSLVQS